MNKTKINFEKRFKSVAWSVATSCALETKEEAVNFYEKLIDKRNPIADESNKTY